MSYYPNYTEQATPNYTPQVDPNGFPPAPDYGAGYQYVQIYQNTHYAYWVPSQNNYYYHPIADEISRLQNLTTPIQNPSYPPPEQNIPVTFPAQPTPDYNPSSSTTTYVNTTVSNHEQNLGFSQPIPPSSSVDSSRGPYSANSEEVKSTPSNSPQVDTLNDIRYMTCTECGQYQIELFLNPCRHPYHLACFKNFCKACDQQIILPSLNQKDPTACSLCEGKENLINCETCRKSVCFLCIYMKALPECCESIQTRLDQILITCPGCEYEVNYSEFLPIKCKEHALLCKKCTILGYTLGKCIMGCNLSLNINSYENCGSCGNLEPVYLGTHRCKKCVVCDSCQWIHNLKESKQENFTCVGCSKSLAA